MIRGTRHTKATSGGVVLRKVGSSMLEFFQYATPTPIQAGVNQRLCDHGITHFCIDVDEIDRA